jgi:hypothetical protein
MVWGGRKGTNTWGSVLAMTKILWEMDGFGNWELNIGVEMRFGKNSLS